MRAMRQHPLEILPPSAPADPLIALLADVVRLRDEVKRQGAVRVESWGGRPADPAGAARALNLGHYLALRSFDLSDLQDRLAGFGLSSLGHSEARVMSALDTLIVTLRRLVGEKAGAYPLPESLRAGEAELEAEAERLFGPRREGAPRTRILATLPAEAATDPLLCERLMIAGMDCARINCAHDDAEVWGAMVAALRAAERKLGRSCRIFMDIAGPKCRITAVQAAEKLRIVPGERLKLVRAFGKRDAEPSFTINFPHLIDRLAIGDDVVFDDGKAAARIVAVDKAGVVLECHAAREKGVRLKADKGVNFPTLELDLPPLTPKDFRDLDFICQNADIVGFSFVQRVEDVELLQDHLAARRRGLPPLALVLKIETPLAVRNLPQLILRAVAHNPTGVMIARGDLAVEIGFPRLSEMQEEILWLCEAARTPVIWATQVLDQYVRDGIASRSEMTDAASAQRAECVMLNKGRYLPEGVEFLADVLTRMDRHRKKKFARFGPLNAWK